jgi:hypothetical protein
MIQIQINGRRINHSVDPHHWAIIHFETEKVLLAQPFYFTVVASLQFKTLT